MAVVDPKKLVKDVDALMADVDMAGSCCNVPDGKMLVYTLALNPGVKAATGMKPPVGPTNLCAKKKQAGTECQWLHLHPGKHMHMDIASGSWHRKRLRPRCKPDPGPPGVGYSRCTTCT
jgi:hypothetical protein